MCVCVYMCVCVCVVNLRTSIHTADVGDQLALIIAGSALGAHTPTTRAPAHTPRPTPPSVFKRVSPFSPPTALILEMRTDRRSRLISSAESYLRQRIHQHLCVSLTFLGSPGVGLSPNDSVFSISRSFSLFFSLPHCLVMANTLWYIGLGPPIRSYASAIRRSRPMWHCGILEEGYQYRFR